MSYNKITKFSDLPQEFGYNQHISIDNELRNKLRAVLWKFKAPVKYAFAYGSGVFGQGKGNSGPNPQIDLIFGVSVTQHWHALNMMQNPGHYSSLRHLGSGVISYVQDHLGAGVYFNPFVEIDGLNIKYGVVNIDTLLTDLSEWNSLYLAGRLHKPVKILRDEPRVRFVNQANLISALRVALLLLPEKFTELDLYKTIAGISYMGDPRMKFGENPNKVANIVNNQFLYFRRLYSPLIDALPNVSLIGSEPTKIAGSLVELVSMQQDLDSVRLGNMVVRLPRQFKAKLYDRYCSKLQTSISDQDPHLQEARNRTSKSADTSVKSVSSEFDRRIASDENLTAEIARAIRNTVSWPSATQTVKGLLTAGIGRSFKYAGEKLQKYRLGSQHKSP